MPWSATESQYWASAPTSCTSQAWWWRILMPAGCGPTARPWWSLSQLIQLGRALHLEADVVEAGDVAAQELQLVVLLVGRDEDLVAFTRGLAQPEHLRHVGYRPFQVGHAQGDVPYVHGHGLSSNR